MNAPVEGQRRVRLALSARRLATSKPRTESSRCTGHTPPHGSESKEYSDRNHKKLLDNLLVIEETGYGDTKEHQCNNP